MATPAKLFPRGGKTGNPWAARCLYRLDEGKIEAPLRIPRDLQPASADPTKIVTTKRNSSSASQIACSIP
ncbi:MAG: hypothetical protein ACRD9L_14720, partial [Bryobacteraceae bacterium]